MSNSNQSTRGTVSPFLAGVAYNVDIQETTDPGNVKELFTQTVAVGKKLNLLKFDGCCFYEGKFKVSIDGDVIASVITGPGKPNCEFIFEPFREVFENEELKIEFEVIAGRPSIEVDCYMQGREITV